MILNPFVIPPPTAQWLLQAHSCRGGDRWQVSHRNGIRSRPSGHHYGCKDALHGWCRGDPEHQESPSRNMGDEAELSCPGSNVVTAEVGQEDLSSRDLKGKRYP